MKIEKTEKKINDFLLNIIIWFSFLADSKYEINEFLRKHAIQIYEHLLEQYNKYKKLYIEFKKRYKEHKNW